MGQALLYDQFHHYFIGLLIIGLSLLSRVWLKSRFVVVLAFGLALFLEEYPIWLSDLDLGLPKPYFYLTFPDNLITVSLGLLGTFISLFLNTRSRCLRGSKN